MRSMASSGVWPSHSGRAVEHLAREHIPVRLDVVVVGGGAGGRVDAHDEHAVVHRPVMVVERLPRDPAEHGHDHREQHRPMVVELVERVVPIRQWSP